MPRPLRIEYPGATYHVVNTASGRRPVFKTDEHRKIFIELIEQMAETYGVEVLAYSLLPNQYHLILRTPRANLSRAMRQLNGVFTQRCNQRIGGSGNLFRGRYKAVLLNADKFLAATARYVHLAPVTAKVAKSPETYRWSSCRAQLGLESAPGWLVTDALKKVDGKKYSDYLRQGVDPETARFYAKKHLEAVRGDAAFKKAARSKAGAKPSAKAKSNVAALPTIMKFVASAFSVSPKHLQKSLRGRGQGNLPRQVAMTLARSPGGYSLQEIADVMHVGHYSSVSVAAARLKTRLNKDDQLRRKVDRLKTQIVSN